MDYKALEWARALKVPTPVSTTGAIDGPCVRFDEIRPPVQQRVSEGSSSKKDGRTANEGLGCTGLLWLCCSILRFPFVVNDESFQSLDRDKRSSCEVGDIYPSAVVWCRWSL